ncbi:acyltransferase family protein [Pseudohoeflea coraliihabitans]|uniref:Acyltransferase n=1 Tax=Pseudohoeflea coraliihabitans TaxID=2860393 RepID=A0ABS6WVF9_9HYPH|nr:acyltransferase [Pseudohoeflea sp. DP4N28-3]MBW3099075.1 acyltransferase [Pseudohoeflea sp. DP4N28-3]
MPQSYRLFSTWRLLAALLVMAYHFCHYHAEPRPIVTWFEHMLPLLDMFFIMSGFLIFDRYGSMENTGRNYLRFLIKRLARLYPLHLFTLSVFVAFALLVHFGVLNSQGAGDRYDLAALPANLLLVQAWGGSNGLSFNYVSWSLSGEWFAYLLFPLILFVAGRGRQLGLVLLLALMLLGLEYADRHAEDKYDLWYYTKHWAAYRVAADFLFGVILCRAARQLRVPPGAQWLAWAMLAATFWAMFAEAGIYLTLAMFGVAITLAALSERRDANATRWLDPLMPVASVSFGVYLWHPVIELFAYSLVWKRLMGAADPVVFWLYLPLPMLATIAVAMFSARHLERPTGKWLEKTLGEWAARRPWRILRT